MSRVFELAYTTPWYITEAWLRTILAIAAREPDAVEIETPRAAVQIRGGEPLSDGSPVVVREGVAIVPVVGPLFKRANLFTRISAATSYDLLVRDTVEAAEHPDVNALLFDFDTPGGAVHGVDEAAAVFLELKGMKPMLGHTGAVAASAGYWLASTLDRIITTELAFLGSIGAVMGFRDTSVRDEREGIRNIQIVSSQSPAKNRDPATREGRADVQAVVDELAEVMIRAIAQNRGVDRDTVIRDYGQGRILVGNQAVRAGLADAIGTFESALAEAAERGRAARRRAAPALGGLIHSHLTPSREETMPNGTAHAQAGTAAPDPQAQETAKATAAAAADSAAPDSATAATQSQPAAETRVEVRHPEITLQYLEERHPKLLGEIREAAAKVERERAKSIRAAAMPGQAKLADQLIDEGVSVEAAAMRFLADAKERREKVATGLARDEQDLRDLEPAASAGGGGESGADPDAQAAAFILNAGKATRGNG